MLTRDLARRARLVNGATFAMPMGGATRAAWVVGLRRRPADGPHVVAGVCRPRDRAARAVGTSAHDDAAGLRTIAGTEYWTV